MEVRALKRNQGCHAYCGVVTSMRRSLDGRHELRLSRAAVRQESRSTGVG